MYLKYPHLTFTSGEFLYQSSTNKSPIRTHGPRLCENIVQALARIVITNQMLRIKQELPDLDVVLTVHDEIICSGPEEEAEFYLNEIMSIMKNPPNWCETLPLDAEGGYSKVYDKQMSNLILTRKKQEAVILYKEIYEAGSLRNEILCEIVVTSLGEKQVKLAFEAKNNIKIDRKEVYEGNK